MEEQKPTMEEQKQTYPEMEILPNIEPLTPPTFKQRLTSWGKYWTSRDGWIGDYVLHAIIRKLIAGLHVLVHTQSSIHEEKRPSSTFLRS